MWRRRNKQNMIKGVSYRFRQMEEDKWCEKKTKRKRRLRGSLLSREVHARSYLGHESRMCKIVNQT